MIKPMALALLLLVPPAAAQAPLTHLGVPAAQLVTFDLSVRRDLTTGVETTDLGTYQNGTWSWLKGAKAIEVPKGRTLVITDVQAWALHEPGTGTPASLELQLEHPAYGYTGPVALFSFPDLPANALGVKRQDWTGGVAVPQGLRVKLWVQQWYPASLLSMARVLVQGYYL